MKRNTILLLLLPLLIGCGNNSTSNSSLASDLSLGQSYIQNLEDENNISYTKIMNTRGSYITSMCYTKTKDDTTNTEYGKMGKKEEGQRLRGC